MRYDKKIKKGPLIGYMFYAKIDYTLQEIIKKGKLSGSFNEMLLKSI